MASVLLALTFVSVIFHANAELDDWQYINRGSGFITISVNNFALYAIKENNELKILENDMGFEPIRSSCIDVSTNEDLDIWVTTTIHQPLKATGTTVDNLKGTGWTPSNGLLTSVSTGRSGLVFGCSKDGNIFSLGGITAALPLGVKWEVLQGSQMVKVSCNRKACFAIDKIRNLYSSDLLPNTNSPMMSGIWQFLSSNVQDVSAYANKRLWKIDTNGVTWEAVNIFDSGFLKVSWERRGYQAEKFKDIAVTNKKAYALANDGRIFVRTGCPIFDFEDDDISTWQQTGTAFARQPVVSEERGAYRQKCQTGDLMIDTFSFRKNYSMPTGSTLQWETPTGTLTSPPFQIRTTFLHFLIGGGSPPNNYAALVVDNEEKKTSSGRSRSKNVKNGDMLMGRFWWDVKDFQNKCAKIHLVDSSSGSWGFTMFDDLRGSPPCFKGMKATWTTKNYGKIVSVGQRIVQSLSLKGFSTTKLRMLTITVLFPVLNGVPLVYFDSFNVTWTHCESSHSLTMEKSPSSSNWPYKIQAKIVGLLSDAVVEIVARVNDHDALQSSLQSMMTISVNYMNEYVHRATRRITAKRLGNETASLQIKSFIKGYRNYSVGENVTTQAVIWHNHTESSQRAYDVTLRLYIPPYMTLLHVHGLNISQGDTQVASTRSQHVLKIRELLLGDNVTITIDIRIDGETKYNRKAKKLISGDLILDVTYCIRKDCRNVENSAFQVNWLLKNKSWRFWYSYENKKLSNGDVFTVIVDKTSSMTFICGSYTSIKKRPRQNCYFKNVTSEWKGLGAMLSNISFYDSTKGELYGAYVTGSGMKIYGERLTEKLMLTQQQWNSMVAVSSPFAKPVHVVSVKSNTLKFDESVTMIGADGYKLSVSADGLSSLFSDAVLWAANLKWRCCY